MVSKKHNFEDDDAVVAVNPASLVSRKVAKTQKIADSLTAANAKGSRSQAAQVIPTAPAAPAPTTLPSPAPVSDPGPLPVTMTEDISEDMSEDADKMSSEQLSSAMPKNKGKGPELRSPPDTPEDLEKKEQRLRDWEENLAEIIESERAEAAWIQKESSERAGKKELKKAKKEWEAQAKKMMEEEIAKEVGAVNKWWQDHYENQKKNCEDEMAQKLQQHVESFKLHFDKVVQEAKNHAEDQAQLGHRVWAELQTKQNEVHILQGRLDNITASLTKGLAQEQEDVVARVFNQKDQEIDRLTAELTGSRSKVEDANKARDDAFKQVADKAEEVKKLEGNLDEVRGHNRDLEKTGVEMDQKLQKTLKQLDKVLETNQTAPQASQQVTKEPDGESQAPTRKSKSTNASNEDARLLEATLAKCREQERLVRDLRRKLAKLARESDSQLKDVKTKMISRLTEAMEERERAVQQLATSQDSEQLTKLKTEHRIFQRRNQDMARKAMEDAADIARLTAQTKLLHSDKQNLLRESRRLQLRGDSYKAQLVIESDLLDKKKSKVVELTIAATAKNNKLADMLKARDAKIKALEKTVREEEETVVTLRQWDAESGVAERDERIGRLEKDVGRLERDEKECLEHIKLLECELLKYRNVGLIEKLSGWVFGTPPVKGAF